MMLHVHIASVIILILVLLACLAVTVHSVFARFRLQEERDEAIATRVAYRSHVEETLPKFEMQCIDRGRREGGQMYQELLTAPLVECPGGCGLSKKLILCPNCQREVCAEKCCKDMVEGRSQVCSMCVSDAMEGVHRSET
jgi:hypothetical protein